MGQLPIYRKLGPYDINVQECGDVAVQCSEFLFPTTHFPNQFRDHPRYALKVNSRLSFEAFSLPTGRNKRPQTHFVFLKKIDPSSC
jgi:hypothetical protein